MAESRVLYTFPDDFLDLRSGAGRWRDLERVIQK